METGARVTRYAHPALPVPPGARLMLAARMAIHPDLKRATNKVLEDDCRNKPSAMGGRIEVKFSKTGNPLDV